MPIVPEKRQLEDHVHGAVASQFWSQSIQNTKSLTGLSCTAPCEPQPLRLNAPSGLSRTQFLVAAQAVRLPAFPGYCDEHGGTVVDRVVVQHGGQNWWAALIGRAKVQRGVNQWKQLQQQQQRNRLRVCLSDPDNYALAATTRIQLSPTTSVKATLQVDSLQQLPPLVPQGLRGVWQPQQQQQELSNSSSSSNPSVWSHPRWPTGNNQSCLCVELKQRLEGLDLTASLGVNESSVEGVRRYCTTPLRLALDVAPANSSSSSSGGEKKAGWMQGLLFRVGLHGVVAPVEAQDTAAAAGSSDHHHQQQHALSVHCQGALAVSGSHTLWEAAQKPWQAAAEAARTARGQQRKQQQGQQQQQQQRELAAEPLSADVKLIDNSSAPVGQESDATTTSSSSSSSDVQGSSKSRRKTQSSRDMSHRTHHQYNSSSSSSGRGRGRYSHLLGPDVPVPLLSPSSVQDTLQETSSALERLRTDLRSWHHRVAAGDLHHLGESKSQSQGLLVTRSLNKSPGSCWSSFIQAPHVKVCGLFGVLGRVPLQQHTLLVPAGGGGGGSSQPVHHSSSAGSFSNSDPAAAVDGDAGPSSSSSVVHPLSKRAKSILVASATHLDRLVLGSAKKLGTNIMQDSVLRPFASGAASLQLGEMRGNFFDFTRIEAALDLGLNAPETQQTASAAAAAANSRAQAKSIAQSRSQVGSSRSGPAAAAGSVRTASPLRGMETILGPAAATGLTATAPLPPVAPVTTAAAQQPAPTPSGSPPPAAAAVRSHHPAFALDHGSVWHALTVSASQQLVGPVRLRGDWRFALESSQTCPRGAALFQPSAAVQLLRHVAAVAPVLVDSSVGVDVCVPGGGGLVRLVGWWSPGRREGGLELRVM